MIASVERFLEIHLALPSLVTSHLEYGVVCSTTSRLFVPRSSIFYGALFAKCVFSRRKRVCTRTQNLHRRHLNSSQAALAEAERARLSEEYAAEVERMEQEAREKQAAGGRTAGRGRPKQASQKIDEAFSDPNERRTDAARARAIGTNRTYLSAAEKLLDEHPN
jgi:hypothetical protein